MEIENLNLDTKRRLLFVSDIHGDLALFKSILNKAKFNQNDYLFVLGDFIEKGKQNIHMIDYLIELEKKYDIYVISGNCDKVMNDLTCPVSSELLFYYATVKKNSILNEFLDIKNIKVDKETDFNQLCKEFMIDFKKYYDYVKGLKDGYYINNKILIKHASDIFLDFISKPRNNNKLEIDKTKIITIVGHSPVINHQICYPDLNPVYDKKNNYIYIDGGNNVLPWGQLNMLIIESLDNMNISYINEDNYLSVEVLDDLTHIDYNPVNITSYTNKLSIKENLGDYYLCKHHYSSNDILVLNKFIKYKNDETVAYNGFYHFIDAKKKEILKLIIEASPYSIVKKDGIVGYVEKNKIKRL